MTELIRVLTKKGRNGTFISRTSDGKVILFSDTDPLTPFIREGDIIEGSIVHKAEKYSIMRIHRILTPNSGESGEERKLEVKVQEEG